MARPGTARHGRAGRGKARCCTWEALGFSAFSQALALGRMFPATVSRRQGGVTNSDLKRFYWVLRRRHHSLAHTMLSRSSRMSAFVSLRPISARWTEVSGSVLGAQSSAVAPHGQSRCWPGRRESCWTRCTPARRSWGYSITWRGTRRSSAPASASSIPGGSSASSPSATRFPGCSTAIRSWIHNPKVASSNPACGPASQGHPLGRWLRRRWCPKRRPQGVLSKTRRRR